jgi:hypothetical protein
MLLMHITRFTFQPRALLLEVIAEYVLIDLLLDSGLLRRM